MGSKKTGTQLVDILKLEYDTILVGIVGVTPLIMNKMSMKARQQLLVGGTRKTMGERLTTVKHDVIAEFRGSVHVMPPDSSDETYLGFPSSGFKKSLMAAAIDIPGVEKRQVGRLLWISEQYVPIWGIPKLFLSVTRSSDINKTPDIRTRAILPRWGTVVAINFARPHLSPQAVMNLVTAAGRTCGLGDWRPEKGGPYGQYQPVELDDPALVELMQAAGREAQLAALERPEPYDHDTLELLQLYVEYAKAKNWNVELPEHLMEVAS